MSDEKRWILGTEVKVGDLIHKYRMQPGGVDCSLNSYNPIVVVSIGSDDGFESVSAAGCFKPSTARTREWLVSRASWGAPASKTPSATALDRSKWNSTCPRCGRGVYQGFASMEHEGGGCR